jgi:hypothetical protein
MTDNYTGYHEDPEAPEITDEECEQAYLDALEQKAETFPAADFSYELVCEAKWEREAMTDTPLPRRGVARIGNGLFVRTGRVA